ncbi:polymorphic toxin-type HINT domain-containing protein [Streptomyces sp. NBC_00073]
MDASRFADQAGVSSSDARAAADQARRHANEANRAANMAAGLARKAAFAARQARDAAHSAATHAENAANAAEEAAKHAGEAATAAAESTKHAEAAAQAAATATDAVDKAKGVDTLAREIDAAELLARTNAGLERAKDNKAKEEAEEAADAQEAKESRDLEAEAKQLAAEAAKPGANPTALAPRARRMALKTAQIRGEWSKVAAEVALAGSDADITTYIQTGWARADQQDRRAQTARLAEEHPSASVRAAAEQALKGDVTVVNTFLNSGQYAVGKEDLRVYIAQVIENAGPVTTDAGRAALNSGDVAKYTAFATTGQYTARTQDERVRAAQLADSGGPELQSAARIALSGSKADLHGFIQSGQYAAQQQDWLSTTHQQRVQQLIAEGAVIAAQAAQDSAEAAEAAATARKADEEAHGYATQAATSAGQAKTYAAQAAKSAKEAEASAARAAEAANTARAAAASANTAARNASLSAADAEISAQSARTSASIAWAYAAKARDTFLQAHNDAATAQREADIAYAKSVQIAEEKAERDRKNAPGREASRQYRCGYDGLGCMTDKQHFRWCLQNKYNCEAIRAAPEYWKPYAEGTKWALQNGLSLSNLYNCYTKNDFDACVDFVKDNLVSNKIRMLRASISLLKGVTGSGCSRCFLAGTKILLSDGSTRNVEEIKEGDIVLSTDPASKATGGRKVTHLVITEGNKHLNDLVIQSKQRTETLTATNEHPFWSPSGNRWIQAQELLPGNTLQSNDGTLVRVVSNHSRTQLAKTYNFTVEDFHTYYVLAGQTPVLVHNSSCGDIALGKQQVGDDDMALDIFGMEVGGLTYKDWPSGTAWHRQIEAFLQDGKTNIHVNLDGIDNPKEYAKSGEKIDPAVDDMGYTRWEMYKLSQSPDAWPRVTWYRKGKLVTNPFE